MPKIIALPHADLCPDGAAIDAQTWTEHLMKRCWNTTSKSNTPGR